MRESTRIRSPGMRNIRTGKQIREQMLEQDLARRRLWKKIVIQLEKEGLICQSADNL
ncbi:MAG: hypothetical protein LUE31_10945 [Lachnospiraceae bacterium]|nr:hypothetical protein [Lachnospiraceae bacterium]